MQYQVHSQHLVSYDYRFLQWLHYHQGILYRLALGMHILVRLHRPLWSGRHLNLAEKRQLDR